VRRLRVCTASSIAWRPTRAAARKGKCVVDRAVARQVVASDATREESDR